MSNPHDIDRIHEDVSAVLPWMVNETLAGDELERALAHVAICTECQSELELLQAVKAGVRRQAATPIVPAPDENGFESLIEANQNNSVRKAPLMAIAASIAGMMVIATWVFLSAGPDSPPSLFEPATSQSQSASMHFVLNVESTEGYSHRDLQRAFDELGAVESYAADDSNSYRVVVSWPARSEADLAALLDQILALPGVESAEVRAVQLPVTTEP